MALDEVQIATADASGGRPYDHLVRPRVVQLDVFDGERFTHPVEHRCSHWPPPLGSAIQPPRYVCAIGSSIGSCAGNHISGSPYTDGHSQQSRNLDRVRCVLALVQRHQESLSVHIREPQVLA